MLTKWITTFTVIFSSLFGHVEAKHQEADYVIVGLGTAGGLLAGRLSEDKKTSVIAIHSGKNYTDSFILKYSQNMVFSVGESFLGFPPNFNPASLNLPRSVQNQLASILELTNSQTKKLYETGETTPQVNADDRVLDWVIAKPAAGASAINAGAWVRITEEVMSEWEAIAGSHWSVSRLSRIYKELEDYTGKSQNLSSRGFCGPITLTQDPSASQLSINFAEATIAATGIPFVIDYNDPLNPLSVSTQIQSAHRGHNGFYRISSVNAFLENIMTSSGEGKNGRKLKVHFDSTALRVIWDGNTAVGVEYLQNGETKSVYAKKGVIVCAGLRSSPFLLYSGIGPASLLNSLDIPVVFDNPNVGQNLIDQTPVPIVFATSPKDSQAGTTTIFSQISNLPSPTGSPDGRQIRLAVIDAIPGITPVIVDLLRPQSRGSITINSANPLAQPVINFGLLSNPDDLNLLVSAFQTYIQDINQQLQLIDPCYELVLPSPDILDDTSLVEDYIRTIANTDYHYHGHCRMAPLNQGGVVDSKGRVHGVKHLLVADNSVIPIAIDGSPMTTAYLVAENIAQLLLH